MGAYVVAALVSLVLGATGLFGKLLAAVPKPITAGVLTGGPVAVRDAGGSGRRLASRRAERPTGWMAPRADWLRGRWRAERIAAQTAFGAGSGASQARGGIHGRRRAGCFGAPKPPPVTRA
ncbi:hypothetical protein M3694_06150 [Kocuria marina]|nr:hypothetical protein [Kocuria marina]